jgi:1,4-dihydroxy-2-naphthoyl-CoA synthase
MTGTEYSIYALLILAQGRTPEMTLQFIRYLRKQFPAIQVSVEIEKPGRPGLQELAEEADVLFYSKTWAQVGKSFTWTGC